LSIPPDAHVTKHSLLFLWTSLNNEDYGYLAFPSTFSVHSSKLRKSAEKFKSLAFTGKICFSQPLVGFGCPWDYWQETKTGMDQLLKLLSKF